MTHAFVLCLHRSGFVSTEAVFESSTPALGVKFGDDMASAVNHTPSVVASSSLLDGPPPPVTIAADGTPVDPTATPAAAAAALSDTPEIHVSMTSKSDLLSAFQAAAIEKCLPPDHRCVDCLHFC